MANKTTNKAALELPQTTAIADLDYAYNLQLQEALAASLQAGSIMQEDAFRDIKNEDTELALPLKLQAEEFEIQREEMMDKRVALKEANKFSEDSERFSHDALFAKSIEAMAEEDWLADGGNFERPFVSKPEGQPFKLCFKGLVSLEVFGDYGETIAGAGVAIYDPDDTLLVRLSKPLGNDVCRTVAEYIALIEGLSAVRELGIRDVTVLGECLPVYNHVIGQWKVRRQKLMKYYFDVGDHIQKLNKVFMVLVPRCENRLALTLARDAIDSQLRGRAQNVSQCKRLERENCSICLDDRERSQMYEVKPCRHRYCFPCMCQHVEVKLNYGCLPHCPHEGCKSKLTLEACKSFLPSKCLQVLAQRIEEAAIPDSDKVYCPYNNCSALFILSKMDKQHQPLASSSHSPPLSGQVECKDCHRHFCIDCHVPWHYNMSCVQYQRNAHRSQGVDAKVYMLANQNRWKQCGKCKHMIELAEGCNHITCRCGFEFCYVCGSQWKNKKATCSCPLWDEYNILRDPLTDEDDDDDYYDEDYY